MPGTRSRASIAARMPSSVNEGGRRTSTTAMSGRCSSIAAIELRAVVDRGDDLPAAVVEQARESLAQQRQVLGDHDTHGSSARIVVPGCALATASVPSSASTRWRRPVRPGAGRIGAAVAVVGDLELAAGRARCTMRTRQCSAPECLATLVSASTATK